MTSHLFNPRFAAFSLQEPNQSSVKDKEELLLELEAFQKISSFLKKSHNVSETLFLCQKMEQLDAFRAKFPEEEVKISKALFDTFQMAQNQEDSFLNQKVTVALLKGYSNIPTPKKEVAEKLIQVVKSVRHPEHLSGIIQRLITRQLETYPTFKDQDVDHALLSQIKDLTEWCFTTQKKSTLTDYIWLRETAKEIANIQPLPQFKEFIAKFPYKSSPQIANKKKLPKDNEIVYPPKPVYRHIRRLMGGRD